MAEETKMPSDAAFSASVKAIQTKYGSRDTIARLERDIGWQTEIKEGLAGFIAEQNSFFLATASAAGQPYIQHRGGPKGFLHVLDPNTLGFADFAGNRQYISTGNLAENSKIHLFLIDYAARYRVKIWGDAKVVDDDLALLKQLAPKGYRARPERCFLIRVSTWEVNCPAHIPQRFDATELAAAVGARDRRIAELEAELAKYKSLPTSR